jgi:hypothetical protein
MIARPFPHGKRGEGEGFFDRPSPRPSPWEGAGSVALPAAWTARLCIRDPDGNLLELMSYD